MTYVYFIQDTRSGHVKIGRTGDVQERLRHLQTGSSTPLRLLGYVEGGQVLERGYHERLGGHGIHGEWFRRDAAFALMREVPVHRWVWLNPGADTRKDGAERRGVAAPERVTSRKKRRRWTSAERRERHGAA